MKIKPIYLNLLLGLALLVIFLLDTTRFLVTHYGGNVNIVPEWAEFVRNAFLVGSLFLYFGYHLYYENVQKPEFVNSVWKAIISCLIFILSLIILKFLAIESDFDRTGGINDENPILIPNSFLTIIKVHVFGGSLFLFSMFIWLKLRDFIFFKRNKTTARNFTAAIIFSIIASILETQKQDSGWLISWSWGVSIFLATTAIVLNSFKLSWVLYVPRKEKITGIFLVVFLIILITFLFAFDNINEDTVSYYSPAVYSFVQLSFLFLFLFGSVSFFSLLFHLPTSEAFERKSSELSSIHSLSRLISDVFDLKDLSEAVVGYSIQSAHAEFGWVELMTESKDKTKKQRVFAYKGIEFDSIENLTHRSEKSIHDKVLSNPSIVLLDKAKESEFLNQDEVTKNKIGSLVVVPLISRGELVGNLFIGKTMTYGFDKEDLDTITTFADQAAIAIDNSRLIEKSLEKERLQQELHIAQKMQMKLLPQTTPVFDELQVESVSYPAYEVGGDYYDFVYLPNGSFGVIVADVSGKGTSAAFYMAEVKGIFQSLARSFYSPKKLLVEANHVLFGTLEKKSFVSLLYAVFDLKKGSVTFARAGHCPLLLVRKTGEYSFIKAKGIGIGLTKSSILEQSMEEVTFDLHEGDVCLLYSDGVVEAMNSAYEEFGYDRLGQLVKSNIEKSASEILQIVITDINKFIYDGRANDDLTLVVTKWTKQM